jgi:hypothetical protein
VNITLQAHKVANDNRKLTICSRRIKAIWKPLMNSKQSPPPLSSIWQCIDRIYCITLKERDDRQASAKAQFARVGLDGQLDFFLAQRHPDNCEQGIFESHLACLSMGLEAGARHILIFEDDVIFGPIDCERLQAGIDFFIRQSDQAILFLGCLIRGSQPTPIPQVRKVRYRCLSHAYLVNAALARRIVATPWQGIAYDAVLRDCTHRHFALYPSIAFQSNSPTDNDRQRTLDMIRRAFGGLRIIQLVNEHYHRYPIIIIAAHVLIIGALILLWTLIR